MCGFTKAGPVWYHKSKRVVRWLMILRDQLNEVYSRLEAKQREIRSALSAVPFPIKAGWYNGHFQRDSAGEWSRNTFPIPEVDVMDLCDIEIHLDRICVTAKMKRDAALCASLEDLMEYEFEAYGVEDYLSDYYHPGQTVRELRDHIKASGETEIGFSFTFPFETEGARLFKFVKLLGQKGFFY